jgi:hypothetical protein
MITSTHQPVDFNLASLLIEPASALSSVAVLRSTYLAGLGQGEALKY